MIMQLGLGSYACAWAIGIAGYEPPEKPLDVFGLVRFANELGLKRVQIADNLPLHMLSTGERAALRRDAEAHGIAIEAGTRGIHNDHLQQYIAIAREMGSSLLRVVVDTPQHHPEPTEIIGLIKAALPALEAAGVVLAVENHDRFKARTLADMMATLNSPQVGICLDTVNSFGALEGPEVVVTALGPYVVNLHLKEFIVKRLDHNMGFALTGMPAGEGMLNIPWLLEMLHGYGCSFNAILELWPEPEATMAATVAKEQAWAAQSVRYLRSLITE